MPNMGKCDPEVRKNGKAVAYMWNGDARTIEFLVRSIADELGWKTDWFYVGGVAVVFTLGDPDETREALSNLQESLKSLEIRVKND